MLRKVMLFVLLSCFIGSTQSFAVEKCLEVESPGNTYGCYGGNCTWWSAYKRPDLNFIHVGRLGRRDAGNWVEYAKEYSFEVKNSPIAGSIAVFSNGDWGHVAHVEESFNDGSFRVTEQDYTGHFVYNKDSHAEAVYKPSGDGYKRDKGSKVYNLLGFIYPTRTILYNYHQINGVAVLMREDGEIVQDCNDVDRVSMFTIDEAKRARGENNFVSFWDYFEGDYAVKLCEQATRHWGFYDINFGEFLQGQTVSDGQGGSSRGKSDPHVGYTHKVGIHKVYVSTKHKRYKNEMTIDINDISKMYFRAKLKRKGVWENVCVDFRISNDDKYSKSQDPRIGTKCKDLTKKKYRKKKKKSVYLKKVDVRPYITEPGEYYVFIEIYDGDHDEKFNRSSEGDEKERALIIVTGLLQDPEPVDPPIEPPVVINPDGSFPIYRYNNPDYGNIQYTPNQVSDHIAWYAFTVSQPDTVPVYEFWSGYHFFYVTGEEERNYVQNEKGWEYKGIAFYAYNQPYSGTMPVYRIYDNDTGEHLYTADDQEKDQWMSVGDKRVDGPGFWVPIQP